MEWIGFIVFEFIKSTGAATLRILSNCFSAFKSAGPFGYSTNAPDAIDCGKYLYTYSRV